MSCGRPWLRFVFLAAVIVLLPAWPAVADNAPGPVHSGPATPGTHSLRLRSGIDLPTVSPPWFVVSPQGGYAPAIPGTSWISPDAAKMCSWAAAPSGGLFTLTTTFILPIGALDPGIVVQVHADDSVAVKLNGQYVGGQNPAIFPPNVTGSPETYVEADYTPGGPFASGTNTLDFELRNYASSCALNYLVVVTFGFFSCPRVNPGGIIAGGPGSDVLTGTPGDDVIAGGDGADVIDGGGGSDIIVGGAGNDILSGGTGDDCIVGDEGNDIINGGGGNDAAFGQAGNDSLFGGTGDDLLDGGDGLDIIWGDSGNDQIFGGPGIDVLRGNADDDLIYGGPGNDSLVGGGGNDGMMGGADSDLLSGASGRDGQNGGPGADTLIATDADGLDTQWGPFSNGFYGPQDSANDTCIRNVGFVSDYTFGCP